MLVAVRRPRRYTYRPVADGRTNASRSAMTCGCSSRRRMHTFWVGACVCFLSFVCRGGSVCFLFVGGGASAMIAAGSCSSAYAPLERVAHAPPTHTRQHAHTPPPRSHLTQHALGVLGAGEHVADALERDLRRVFGVWCGVWGTLRVSVLPSSSAVGRRRRRPSSHRRRRHTHNTRRTRTRARTCSCVSLSIARQTQEKEPVPSTLTRV